MTIRSLLAGALLTLLTVLGGLGLATPAHSHPSHPAASSVAVSVASSAASQPRQTARQNQGDPGATYWPVVSNPIGHRWGTGRKTYVALDARRDAWGHATRRFAAYVDGQHLGVWVFVHGSCASHPHAACTKVREDAPASCGCYAEEVYDGLPMVRLIQVRPDVTTNFYAIIAHEFGHVLGLGHHDHHGVDGAWPNEVRFSSAERQALVAMYVWVH